MKCPAKNVTAYAKGQDDDPSAKGRKLYRPKGKRARKRKNVSLTKRSRRFWTQSEFCLNKGAGKKEDRIDGQKW